MVLIIFQWEWWFFRSPADLFDIWVELNWLSRCILVVLLVMLVHALVTTVAMAAKHAIARRQSRLFAGLMPDLLRQGRMDEAMAASLKFKTSPVAAVTRAGLWAFRGLPLSLTDEDAHECAERAMQREGSMRAAEMRVGLGSLRTIAGTAPLLGMFGAVLGILGSFRGYSGPPWGLLMMVLSGCSIALVFAALGILTAVLAVWAHNWLVMKSDALDLAMGNAAFETMAHVTAHPEWRGGETAVSFECWEEGSAKGRSWEVTYDRHGAVLAVVWAFELYFLYIIMDGIWWSMSTDSGYAYTFGLLLLAAGLIALAMWSGQRGAAACVAGPNADADSGFYHPSIEQCRKEQFVLKERFARLPDRGLFSAPILVMLMVIVLINNVAGVPRGIPVEIVPRESALGGKISERPVVVHVQKKPGSGYMEMPLLRVQGKLVTESELCAYLGKELERRDDPSVIVYGDKELPFDAVIRVMDRVIGLGGRAVLVGE